MQYPLEALPLPYMNEQVLDQLLEKAVMDIVEALLPETVQDLESSGSSIEVGRQVVLRDPSDPYLCGCTGDLIAERRVS